MFSRLPPGDPIIQTNRIGKREQHIVINPMNRHTTTIHSRCPYAPVWDYYTLHVDTVAFVKCEDVQAACDEVRGKEMTQEQVFEHLRLKIGQPAKLTLKGRHGQNGRLVICG